MRMLTVTDSNNIEAVGYDPLTLTLRVQFKGGRAYDYSNVSADFFAAMVSAPSIGSYHARSIRGLFPHKLVLPEGVSTADTPPDDTA